MPVYESLDAQITRERALIVRTARVAAWHLTAVAAMLGALWASCPGALVAGGITFLVTWPLLHSLALLAFVPRLVWLKWAAGPELIVA